MSRRAPQPNRNPRRSATTALCSSSPSGLTLTRPPSGLRSRPAACSRALSPYWWGGGFGVGVGVALGVVVVAAAAAGEEEEEEEEEGRRCSARAVWFSE